MEINYTKNNSGHILVINPGSTSTKLAVYTFDVEAASLKLLKKILLDHTGEKQTESNLVVDQLAMRQQAVENFLESIAVVPDLIMARGAPLKPRPGGVYAVDQVMIEDLQSARYANHASNLAAMIGRGIAIKRKLPVYIADPITTDEFEPLARISGVPGMERKSRSHALNIKASTRKLCQKLDEDFSDSRWVVCHMGGGISVAALKNGKIIDVNDALLGMGPFSPERAGALPASGLLELAYSSKYSRDELELLLSKGSGLKGYLGTADLKEVEQRIDSGDKQAELIFQAMIYQIVKEISAMASVLTFELDGILLTGGMANSSRLCDLISQNIRTLSSVYIEPGDNELEALAEAGLRVLLGEEIVKTYS